MPRLTYLAKLEVKSFINAKNGRKVIEYSYVSGQCRQTIHVHVSHLMISGKERWSFLQICQETFSYTKRRSYKRAGNTYCTGRRRTTMGAQVCRKCCVTIKRGDNKFREWPIRSSTRHGGWIHSWSCMKNTTDTRKYGASFICKYLCDCELRHCAADTGFKNGIVPTSTILNVIKRTPIFDTFIYSG